MRQHRSAVLLGICAPILAACGSATSTGVPANSSDVPSASSDLPSASPSATSPTSKPATTTPAPASTHKASTAPKPTKPSALDPQFPTCKAAKAAGYGPYHRGKDAEYDWYTDRDGDGIVCE